MKYLIKIKEECVHIMTQMTQLLANIKLNAMPGSADNSFILSVGQGKLVIFVSFFLLLNREYLMKDVYNQVNYFVLFQYVIQVHVKK
jgi:hypothetical protein